MCAYNIPCLVSPEFVRPRIQERKGTGEVASSAGFDLTRQSYTEFRYTGAGCRVTASMSMENMHLANACPWRQWHFLDPEATEHVNNRTFTVISEGILGIWKVRAHLAHQMENTGILSISSNGQRRLQRSIGNETPRRSKWGGIGSSEEGCCSRLGGPFQFASASVVVLLLAKVLNTGINLRSGLEVLRYSGARASTCNFLLVQVGRLAKGN